MASHLLFFRLSHGKVWHVACSGALVALCGQSIPARGERQPKRPPFGARPCPDCYGVTTEAVLALSAATESHSPRVYAPDLEPDLLVASQEGENPEVELPVCEDCGHPFATHDSSGVCRDLTENGDDCECDEYLVMCVCGHPWALHDVDTSECCYRDEETAEADAEPVCGCEQFRPVLP